MAPSRTFPFRYGATRPLMVLLGAGPKRSSVTIEGGRLRVRMGWFFTADIPLSSIVKTGPDTQLPGGIGAHGWRGNWLVNGSVRGLVRLELEPAQRARVMGVPVKLRVLRVSMEAPEEFLAALADGGVHQHGEDD